MKVSIVIATYGECWWKELALERALPSAQAQNAHEVRTYHDPGGSIAGVRNTAASEATGDWLCFLDADDELSPGYIEAMGQVWERMHKDGASLLLTPAVSYVHKGKPRPPMFHPVGDFRSDNYVVVGTLVERALFNQVGGFGDYPHGFEDWSLWAKCWKAGARVVRVKRAIYRAHVNPSSKHRLGWKDRQWQVTMHEQVRKELFPEERIA